MPRAGKRITPHFEAVYKTLRKDRGKTASQVAVEAGVSGRTARMHLTILVQDGRATVAPTWPALQYFRS